MRKIDMAKQWLKKAKDDLIAASHMIRDIYPKQIEISCYHSQQAVEKALKAHLVFHDVEPPYTHDLGTLCELCSEYSKDFSDFYDDCDDLTIYATRTRYPDSIEIEEQEAKEAFEKASEIYRFVSEHIQ